MVSVERTREKKDRHSCQSVVKEGDEYPDRFSYISTATESWER